MAADDTVRRSCSSRLVPAGTPGVARATHRTRTASVLTARLRGRGDWDLALFSGGRLIGASSSFGGRERVDLPVRGDRRIVAQACRRSGRGRTARLTFVTSALPAPTGEKAQLVRVALLRAGDHERLEALGLDVTHAVTPTHADVVVYTAAERLQLARAGFPFTVRIPNLRASDAASLLADARVRGRSSVPSGRTTYRTLSEYQEDLKKIVETYPGFTRRIEIGTSLEGIPLEGVELASNVASTDDGRPTFVVMGLHHAREWPAGEMPMEFAIDLAAGYGKDPRITSILERVRVIALPVINPDGFNVSRTSGPIPGADDNQFATLPLVISDGASYKRKNCRAFTEAQQSTPCMSRPAGAGVDLNRNYGAYWGGVGSSSDPPVQTYRGTAPYSEPESEAVHKLSQTRNIVTLITHHTFTADGVWLRQPGFCTLWGDPETCDEADVVPDEAGMAELGAAMAAASGWRSALGWDIGEITGATEDWNYFAASAYGYTPEQRGPNFHPTYATAVEAEYTGAAEGAAGGVREALLRAAEQAADRRWHSVLTGTAAPGSVLRVRKAFDTVTSQPGVIVKDTLDMTMTVPASGSFTWDLNPSTRPLAPAPETYTLTCENAAGAVLDTREVLLERAKTTAVTLCGGRTGGGGSGPGGAGGGPIVAKPALRVAFARTRLSSRRVNRTKRFRVRVLVQNGEIRNAVVRLARGKRTLYRSRRATASRPLRMTLRRARRKARLRPGRHRLTLTAKSSTGARVVVRKKVRVRR